MLNKFCKNTLLLVLIMSCSGSSNNQEITPPEIQDPIEDLSNCNTKRSSNILFEDLSKNSEKLISYIRPNKTNKNVLYSEDGTMLSLEKKYLNSK